MILRNFHISDVMLIEPDANIYMGIVEFAFFDRVAETDVSQIVRIKLRISCDADATFHALEQKFLAEAVKLLDYTFRHASVETIESLRLQAEKNVTRISSDDN